MSYQRVPQDPYPPPGYNPYFPPPPPEGHPSAPPPPSFDGYPPPPPSGFPAYPPPEPPQQPPYEGYQGYFAEGYPPPPGGNPQYQQCHPQQYEQYHYQEDQSDAGCFAFLQGCCQFVHFGVQGHFSFHASETLRTTS
ncbi:basic salivary proline-rich protein 2-like isoform X1 [Hibiscus syriacus]|uniref:basic salivary proline-rich protein 2-like isoform X1 n=1 Tax=Hibiscus syriacus TaxID=106335 RepID=UPI0019251587|nr:basic salivary proline-rich protein 2-like isoform X1 [Hibiscus syriacus]